MKPGPAPAGFDIPIGALTFTVPDRRMKVPGLLWESLAWAAELEHDGYEALAIDELAKISAWLKRPAPELEPEVAAATTQTERTWCVLRVNSGQERFASDALTDKGIRTYVPLHITEAKHARRKATRTRPLIAGYVFANLPDDHALATAVAMRGVEIMCREGKPRYVPPMAIATLAFFEACHAFDETWTPPPIKGKRYSHAWKKGDRVKIQNHGPFAGFHAIVHAGRQRDQMEVVLSIFGRPTNITVPHRDLVKFDACEALQEVA